METPRQINLEVKRLVELLWTDIAKSETYLIRSEDLLISGLKQWPDHLILHSNLGAIYDYQFRREEAYSKLGHAIRHGADDYHTIFNFGVVKTHLDHSDAGSFLKHAHEHSMRDDTFACYIDFQAM